MSLDVLTAVWRSPPCKGGDLLCLLAIADNADEKGYAWPSISTIARKAAMTERGAQKCIAKLVESELILVKVGGGYKKTNAYQITTNGIGEHLRHNNPERSTPNSVQGNVGENPEHCDINPEQNDGLPRTPVHPNSHRTVKEHSAAENPPSNQESDLDDFEEFKAAFPKLKSESTAKRSFEKALATGVDARTLIDAARVYGVQQLGNDRMYIASAETWLGEERWTAVTAAEVASLDSRLRSAQDIAGKTEAQIAIEAIQSGKQYRCKTIPHSLALGLVKAGHVTFQQARAVDLVTRRDCEAAGIAI